MIKINGDLGKDLADIKAKVVLLDTKINALINILQKDGVTTKEEVESELKEILRED